MSYNTHPTVVTGQTWTAANHNLYVKGNLDALWPFTTAGDTAYATGATALSRLAIGAARKVFRVNNAGNAPEWGGMIATKVRRAANQSISNATNTDISFDTEDQDTDAFFSAGSPTIITLPYTGYYMIGTYVQFVSNSTGVREARLFDSNSVIIAEDKRNAVGSSDVTSICISGLFYYPAGTTIKVRVQQNSGGSLNAIAQLWAGFIGP